MIEFLKFTVAAWKAYTGARREGRAYYAAVTYRDVPQVAVFVGIGREAWRISERAVQEFR